MKRLSRPLAALGLLLALVVTPAHAELTPVEGGIVQAVKARSRAALALLERSVNINSGTLNVDGVKGMGRVFRAELDELGFAARWIDRARSRMREIVAKSLPGTSATITFSEAYPPMAATPANEALLQMYSQLSVELGWRPVKASNPETRGSGDVQFAAPYAASLDGLGATGGGAHSPLEYLHPESIEKNAIRAALMIYRLTR